MNEVQSFIPTGLASFGSIIAGVIVLAIVVFWVISLRRVVPTNMVHIVQSSNKTTEYGKGRDSGNVYYHWPSHIPLLGVTVTEFPESIFQIQTMQGERSKGIETFKTRQEADSWLKYACN
jgi:hypothetical protein